MIRHERCIVIDLDGTLCALKREGESYADLAPNAEVIRTLRKYRAQGFSVIIQTSRNMRTYDGNVGAINANTLPIVIEWLRRHDVPFDEVHVGKPWPGRGGFYVDDRAIRPDEFCKLTYEQIRELTADGEGGG